IKDFFVNEFERYDQKFRTEAVAPIQNKVGQFLSSSTIRNIVGQSSNSIDMRKAMDESKIMLVDLSIGRIGEDNSALLGSLIITKIQMAAMSRAEMSREDRTPFYLYVDEFQNFITDVFATILSESRKYKLALNITNQYIAQLDEKIRDAVIGNAGTMIAFRIGAADAEFLVKEFEPLSVDDMVNVDKFCFYVKMLINNAPSIPFNGQGLPPDKNGDPKIAKAIYHLSRLKYGKSRKVVDLEIRQRTKIDEIKLSGLNDTPPAVAR
ncbi:MAG: type IV secretory system conjugative DNA transfer family protein, partial [bacterium]